MFKSIFLVVVVLAAIAFAKEESASKKKEEYGTVIGIDLGVSVLLSLRTERRSPMSLVDNLFLRWYIQKWPCRDHRQRPRQSYHSFLRGIYC